jgi:DNA primase
MLSRITKNVVVLFDGDSAGIEASERSLPILLGSDVYPKGLTLPSDQDPDDFVKAEGAEALRKLVANAQDLFSVVLGRWLQGYRGEASEKVRISSRLQPIFSAIQDVRLKSLYLKEAAQKMNVDEKWLRESLSGSKNDYGQKQSQWNSANQAQRTASSNAPRPMQNAVQSVAQNEIKDQEQLNDVISLKGTTPAEKLLIALVLKNHANYEVFATACSLDNITHVGISEVLKRISEVARQVPEKFDKLVSLLTNFVDQPEVLIADNRMDSDDTKLILDCVKKIKEKRILEKRNQLTKELKTSVAGSEQHQELMKALMDLKKEELEQRR